MQFTLSVQYFPLLTDDHRSSLDIVLSHGVNDDLVKQGHIFISSLIWLIAPYHKEKHIFFVNISGEKNKNSFMNAASMINQDDETPA